MKSLIFSFSLAILLSCNTGSKADGSTAAGLSEADSLFSLAFQTNSQWPSYRGYLADGFLSHADLPDHWDLETMENIKWRLQIPGLGLSCPVIWNDRIFVTTALSESDQGGFRTGIYGDIEPVSDSSVHRWIVYCIDRNKGEVLWENTAHTGIPMVKRHPKSTHANTSVATDGNFIVAFFGSEGLYCYDFNGNLAWKKDFGLIRSAWNVYESAEWEFSSSPVIYDGKVVIQVDALNTSFVAALNLKDGKILWKQERDEIPGWCTPNVYMHEGNPRLVVNGFRHRGAYDLDTGEEIWNMSGGGDIPIPTPVVWNNLIFFNSAHGRNRPLMAIEASAAGSIPYPKNDSVLPQYVRWFNNRQGPYMSSVLVYQDLLYAMRWNGNLSCQDPETGELFYSETVEPGSFIASPVASDGKIYLVQEEGDVYVVRAGRTYELIGKSSIGGISLVTPGIANDMIIFRTENELIAVSKTQ